MNKIEKDVYYYLIGKGFNKKVVCAIMGNIKAESGFNVNCIEKGNNIGFGLCQWSFGRRKQLEKYGTSLKHQLEFLYSEITGIGEASSYCTKQYINRKGYLTLSEFLSGKFTIEQMTESFCFCWERPNVKYAHLDRRIESAKAYYKEATEMDVSSYVSKLIHKGYKIDFNLWKNENVIHLSNVPALLCKFGGIAYLTKCGVITDADKWYNNNYTKKDVCSLIIKFANSIN